EQLPRPAGAAVDEPRRRGEKLAGARVATGPARLRRGSGTLVRRYDEAVPTCAQRLDPPRACRVRVVARAFAPREVVHTIRKVSSVERIRLGQSDVGDP